MNKRNFLILFAVFFLQKITAQKVEDVKEISLETIEIISSPRIELPFSENSRTIHVITKEEIKNLSLIHI